MSFTGKLIAISGAASGIGLATARLLAQRGALLSLSGGNGEALDKAKQAWIYKTTAGLGPLHGAANAARVGRKSAITDPLDSLMNALRAQGNHVSSEGASIVNVTNLAGVTAVPFAGVAYTASEHGVRNIRVNCVPPGTISTPPLEKAVKQGNIHMEQISALRRLGTAEDTAYVIAFLLSQESPFVTGSTYNVDERYIY
ncbi:hypothetical protein BDV36DRAFT_278819 [Aspergillus pseudocaelatus]|uniref:NAD(P)-binding protein n=1 Tax=Aspergillus pseudocaelatus TaxID=1825620 RepID=A0ABQ6X387_9EURO|nr:hypothetical protein BDV36DRAFT_278819 [Aspergillus pseudocaelatus]